MAGGPCALADLMSVLITAHPFRSKQRRHSKETYPRAGALMRLVVWVMAGSGDPCPSHVALDIRPSPPHTRIISISTLPSIFSQEGEE
ncbi:hypothetical protein JZ751_018753, partial [Albula glossodonta]